MWFLLQVQGELVMCVLGMLVLLLEWCVRFGAGLLVLLRVLLLEWRVRFRAGLWCR